MANGIRSALQALARDGADAVALASLALGLFATRRFEEALDTARRAVASNPNYAIGHAVHGVLRAYFGDYEGCVEAIGRAQRLSPRDPAAGVWLSQMAVGAFVVGRHAEGVEHAHRAVRATPAFRGGYRALAANLVALGRIDDARRVILDSDAVAPIGTLAQLRALAFPDGDAHERFCAALGRAGVPEDDATTVPATAARPRLVEPAYAA